MKDLKNIAKKKKKADSEDYGKSNMLKHNLSERTTNLDLSLPKLAKKGKKRKTFSRRLKTA